MVIFTAVDCIVPFPFGAASIFTDSGNVMPDIISPASLRGSTESVRSTGMALSTTAEISRCLTLSVISAKSLLRSSIVSL